MAEVVDARTFNIPDRADYRLPRSHGSRRPSPTIEGSLTCTFFGQPRLINYWQGQLQPGARGIFAGKVEEFNRKLQLAHPDFVILDEHGAVIGGAKHNAALASASGVPLVGLYPMAGKLRTWTIADCAALALDSLAGIEDPLPDWIREAAEVVDLEAAFRAVHQPTDRARSPRGPRAAAVRRGVRAAADHGVPAGRRRLASGGAPPSAGRWTAGRVRCAVAVHPDPGPDRGQRGDHGRAGPDPSRCSGCCRARSARARPWSRCGRCWQSSTPAARPRCWRRPRCWPPSTSRRSRRLLGDLAERWHARRAGTRDRRRADHRSIVRGPPSRGDAPGRHGRGRDRHRHPRPAQRRGAVRRPGPRRGRRAAPVRGRAARRAERQGERPAARAGDDRDPDPALGGHDRLR